MVPEGRRVDLGARQGPGATTAAPTTSRRPPTTTSSRRRRCSSPSQPLRRRSSARCRCRDRRRRGWPVPPAGMPLLRGRRPLKRWRYVGLYGPDVMLCVGAARVGDRAAQLLGGDRAGRPLLRAHDAVARRRASRRGLRRGRRRATRASSSSSRRSRATSRSRSSRPSGAHYIWTRKQLMRARGVLEAGGAPARDRPGGLRRRQRRISRAPHRSGSGRPASGSRAAASASRGTSSPASTTRRQDSERTVWVDGRPAEAPPVDFAADLDSIESRDGSRAASSRSGARARTTRTCCCFAAATGSRSARSPGALPGGVELAEGYGVMEDHDVFW